MIKIRYTIIFSAIFLLIVYQLLLSFNVLPYFFTGQDIIILLIFLISIFLFFIAHALEKISAKLYEPGQSIAVSVNTEDYLPPDFTAVPSQSSVNILLQCKIISEFSMILKNSLIN